MLSKRLSFLLIIVALLAVACGGNAEVGEIPAPPTSAQANRVPVIDGHLASVSVKLARPASADEAIAALRAWQPPAICAQLPSTPHELLIVRDEPDRPQPRRDRDAGNGLAWTVGKVRECPVLDVRYIALTHNTLRGAASGALLNAELLAVQGYIGE